MVAAINACVLFNAIRHDPYVGYDARAHFKYAQVLAKGKLPGPRQTREFFSAPLPYVLPAVLLASGLTDERGAAKAVQLSNVALSVAVLFLMLGICRQLRPGDRRLQILALLCVGMLPVYYKTFAQARGEPLVCFLVLLVIHEAVAVLCLHDNRWWRLGTLAVAVGLLPLSRQWGVLILPAVGLWAAMLWLKLRLSGRTLLRVGSILLLALALISGWFYLHLEARYGSIAAFNLRGSESLTLTNQPATFYLGLGGGHLFSRPVRPAFPNQLIPIFYSETWGDYWCYFLVSGRNAKGFPIAGKFLEESLGSAPTTGFETNAPRMVPYLGRVNLVSLFPTAILLVGLGLGLGGLLRSAGRGPWGDQAAISGVLTLAALSTLVGYLWFLIMHPVPGEGDTIKASYALQVFPLLAILAAEFLAILARHAPRIFRWAWVVLLVAGLHNLPAFFTRFGS